MFAGIFFLFAIPIAEAQYYGPCNPKNGSSWPPSPAFPSSTTSINFNEPYPDGVFTLVSDNTITRNSSGLYITINAIGEEPFIMTNSISNLGSHSNYRLFIFWKSDSDNKNYKCHYHQHFF